MTCCDQQRRAALRKAFDASVNALKKEHLLLGFTDLSPFAELPYYRCSSTVSLACDVRLHVMC